MGNFFVFRLRAIGIRKYEAEEFDFKTAIINYINQAYEK